MKKSQTARVEKQRRELLLHITRMTDKLMIALAFVWVGLMIADLLGKSSPPLVILNYVIWGIFILDFLVKFFIAPRKGTFLRAQWITIISLILPAFRILRIFQALNALRALSLVRILTSLNRSMRALVNAMGKRGVGYVTILTIIVLFAGAAGMYQFENPDQLAKEGYGDIVNRGGGLQSYSDAVWWTAMLMTTIGSQYWPVTMAGRVLCFIISMYSLGVFGYITATLASFFVDEDTKNVSKKLADGQELSSLRREMETLRKDLKKQHSKL
jgi:voltage-gated potassium channel